MTLIPEEAPVRARVQRLLPFGLLVSLDDGSLGIIREREIAWDSRERRSWRQRFKSGDVLRVMRLGEGLDQRLELSLRLVENDPWIGIDSQYPLGALVEGTVVGIQPYGAFVELCPGVTGLLHVSRLPVWATTRDLGQIFWAGDRVRAMVERIDLKHRHIGLSLGRAWAVRWRAGGEEFAPEVATLGGPAMVGEGGDETAAEEELMPTWTIMVIEDDPAQLGALTRWMQQAGHHVLAATSGESALELLEAHQPDLVLSDFGLPNMSGVEVLQRIHNLRPSLRCALMTDWAGASEQMDAIAALRATGMQLLVKPLSPADIVALLTESIEPSESDVLRSDLPITNALPHAPAPAQRQLRDLLRRLCSQTDAIKAILFALDPAQRRVTILGEAGSAVLCIDAAIDLIHSPVRDVAEDRQICRIDDAQQAESRVRYLKPLLSFRSCLGVRLPAQMAEDYALFVFSAQPAAFDEHHEAYVTATALAATALLERRTFQGHAQELQRLALLGQLSRALVHEINHQLSPLNFVLSDIKHQLNAVEQRAGSDPRALERDMHEMREIVSDLSRGLQSLTDTARMFGRVTMQAREQSVALDSVLDDVVQLLRDTADRAHVRLLVHLPDDIPPVHIHALQLQQMLLNIALNAIQQIALARPTLGGRVVLRVETGERDGHPVTRICVEDDGPGIHRQLWERIFDLGFTTRAEGGSGLGLYITRSLGDALGCRVFVEESCMLWGAMVVIELPAEAVTA